MPELTYPGVYIEEKAGAPAPIQGVSTSTLALVGWTTKGPINDPTLVTGFKEFERKFGTFTSDGLVPTTLHAYFKNGGSLARIVRVAASDSVIADTYISEPQSLEDSGDNGNNTTTAFTWTATQLPVEPASWTHSHWKRATPVAGVTTVSTAPNGVIVIWKTAGATGGEGTFVVPAALSSGIEPGTLVITWASSGAKTMTDNGSGVFTGDGNAAGSTVNYLTGAITFDATGDIPDAGLVGTITIAYTPMTQSTNGADTPASGKLTGTIAGDNIASGTIDYVTGAIAVTYTVAPASVYPTAASSVSQDLKFSYGKVLWEIDLQWPGAAGNNYSVVVSGTSGQELDSTASYSLWTLQVLEDGIVVEQYDDLNFLLSTSSSFFPLVINDKQSGSSLITITDVGNTGVPSSLSGVSYTAETATVTPAVDGSETAFAFTTSAGSVYETSMTINYTSGGVVKTVIDDGDGNLTGDVSGSASSTVTYTTGVVALTCSLAPDNGTLITVTYYSSAASTSVTDTLSGGSDGSAVTSSDIIGASLEAPMKGLYALNKTDDLLLVVTPDFAGDSTTDQAVLDYCTTRMDRFAILTTTEGMTYDAAVTYKRRTLGRNSTSYGAIYWPWVQIIDPVTEKALNIPPIGHVAGVYARTDANRNVGKAPAGAQDGSLRFLLGLAQSPTKSQVGVLNRGNVNAIVDWPQVGSPAVWGARTLESVGEWRYIQARRLFMFLEKSIYNATHIYVFENNGSALWARIRLQLSGFLFNLFQQGYFAGDTPEDAYYVVVDSTNNPQTSIDAGELYVDVGIAPNKPAEFLVFRFQTKIPG